MPPFRLATRSSPLARWQAERVASLLHAAHPGLQVELVHLSTTGDRLATTPVWEMGGQGVFVGEVQAAVLEGRADGAVHSAKDLQPVEIPGLVLAAIPERGDPRDALVGCPAAALRPGTVVATGSQRRRAQLAAAYPGLVFESLRGNIATRLSRVPPGGAIVVAMAALQRLGLRPEPMEALSPEVMVPQVAQGALAVECRGDDASSTALLAAIDDEPARATVTAERAFLSSLGGGCDLPVAGHAWWVGPGELTMEGLVASVDGGEVVRCHAQGPAQAAEWVGRTVAGLVLAGGGHRLIARGQADNPSAGPGPSASRGS